MPLIQLIQAGLPKELSLYFAQSFSDYGKIVTKRQSKSTLSPIRPIIIQLKQLISFIHQHNFYQFYFQLFNNFQQNKDQHIASYFLQLRHSLPPSQKQISLSLSYGAMSVRDLDILQKNIYSESDKCRKNNYREELVRYVYQWLGKQIWNIMQQKGNQIMSTQIIGKVIHTHNNICCTILLQIMQSQIITAHSNKINIIMGIVDTCIFKGSKKTALQTIIFVVPAIFSAIYSKKLLPSFELSKCHFELWREAALKLKLPTKLLNCLCDWLVYLFADSKQQKRQKQTNQIAQLYRKQLLQFESQLQQNSIQGLIYLLHQLQQRKIQQIYAEIHALHSQMKKSSIIQHNKQAQSFEQVSRLSFSYKISGMSKSNSEINSILNSFYSHNSKLPNSSQTPVHSMNDNLKIYSKRQSINQKKEKKDESTDQEQIQIIIGLIQLFDCKISMLSQPGKQISQVSKSSRHSQNQLKQQFLLPIISTHQQLPISQLTVQTSKLQSQSDPKWQNRTKSKLINLYYQPIREQDKLKIIKNRGLVIKNSIIQIGYLLQSQQTVRFVSFFISFPSFVNKVDLLLKQNSIKFTKELNTSFTHPPQNKQFKFTMQISKVKLYNSNKTKGFGRYIKNRINIGITDAFSYSQQSIQIPMHPFQIIEWLQVDQRQLFIFQKVEPLGHTEWFNISHKYLKNRQQYINKVFPFHQKDSHGNILLKCIYLSHINFVKILIVMQQMKIQLFSTSEQSLAMSIVQMMGGPQK